MARDPDLARPSAAMLLILDLDETLIHAAKGPPPRPADFVVGAYSVWKRPHLDAFLTSCAGWATPAFWSSATDAYVRHVVDAILPAGLAPAFAWGRGRCTRRQDPETREDVLLKDLAKVRRRGFDLRRTLIVDDTPGKVARHYGNAVYVPPYFGDPDDDVLPRLADYLATLRDAADVRVLEKRGWLPAGRG
ncbi:HAD family hydrolase [Paludisphaera mucosa]|uniref:HAD family hydrolase n=1 Tax=Paludisphaera mucosa TaxID=3030827 RepID=A0ABT6FJP5_9BACT|nr:HAD family hydrolase [Paludisphaera mucosa]MDG3007764.1 HAD family hydrolase [Paludisphaera mucosa]